MKQFAILILLLLFGSLSAAHAQTAAEPGALPNPPEPFDRPVRFTNLTIEDGLAQGTIHAIHQDRQGFLWFGTQAGLSRFDGYTFKNYEHIPFDSTSAQASWVTSISEDPDGTMWLGTFHRGISRFDPGTEKFTHYALRDSSGPVQGMVWPVLTDGDAVWAGTSNAGLGRMDFDVPGRFTFFGHDPRDPRSLSSNRVRSLHRDASGTLWVGTLNGLNRMDPARPGRFDRFIVSPQEAGENDRPEYIITDIYEGVDGILWVSTLRGVVRLNPTTGEAHRILPDPADRDLNEVGQIAQDPEQEHVLWMNVARKGLARFDTKTESFDFFRHDPTDPSSPMANGGFAILADRSGTLWAGMGDAEGVTKFNPSAVSFRRLALRPRPGDPAPSSSVWGIFVDKGGDLWLGFDGGLYRVDRATEYVTQWLVDWENARNSRAPAGTVRMMTSDNDGMLWLATSRGLDRLDPRRGGFQHFQHVPDDSSTISSDQVRTILVTRDGTLWVGTNAGLDRLDAATRTFIRYGYNPNNPRGLGGPFAVSIYEDIAGTLWVGTQNGLSRLDDAKTGTFTNFKHDPNNPGTLTDDIVFQILERDREPGILWLVTHGGLDRFDTRSGEVRHYTQQNSGLPNNGVYIMLEDDEGRLWISTNRGISCFDPDEETFRNYGIEHGLQSLEFNQYAAARSPEGEMFFGGVKGINAFYPEEIEINAVPPPVVLTQLRLFNEPLVVGPDSPLKEALGRTRELRLTHDQARNLGIDFVALHFKNPGLNRYTFRLEGFDKGWIDAGSQRSATYTNLPPGEYTFRVKAANSDGVWNEEGAVLQLAVLPPWWRTSWAYALYGLLFAGGFVAAGRYQRLRLQKKAAFEQAELRAMAAESEKEAAEAQALALKADNERKKNVELLSELGKEITSSLDLETIFGRIYDHVNNMVDAAIFGIGLYNAEKEQIEYRLAIENGKRYAPYVRDTRDKNQFPVWCLEHREPVFVNDVATEYSKYIESYRHLGGRLETGEESEDPQSLIYLPLETKDRLLGVITIQSFRKNAYTEHDLNILRALATYAAIAIDNADAYRRLNVTLDNLREMQQQLVQQEKLASLGQLTAGIAHEIKNPLNFVTNFAAVIEELATELSDTLKHAEDLIPEDLRRELDDLGTGIRLNAGHVAKHGNRADRIVKGMMEHASGGHGERFVVDVNAFVEEYVGLAYHGRRAQSPDLQVEIIRDLDTSAGTVEMAPQEVGRVLVNLLSNAFDAIAERRASAGGAYRPEVTVQTRRNNGRIEIHVRDNGSGIPAAVRPRIFEPFFTTKPTGSGTGLGLSLSYDIITQGHRGSLSVESEEGAGSVFTVSLPAA